jgi:hypothetical protein
METMYETRKAFSLNKFLYQYDQVPEMIDYINSRVHIKECKFMIVEYREDYIPKVDLTIQFKSTRSEKWFVIEGLLPHNANVIKFHIEDYLNNIGVAAHNKKAI